MHIHILGICGKFMSGLAIIARQMGFRVSGSDQQLIPSIAERLRSFDIDLRQGYSPKNIDADVKYVIIGNALSRGCPVVEHILNEKIPYFSGPAWLSQEVLRDYWVIAVSGTHGKTTTASMVTWILEKAGLNPAFLIGGHPNNFTDSARYTDARFFVIEADEYDTAFFDKRSKFLHYQPKTLIINNLEFDHADIFENLGAIKKQFHHLLRIVPSTGLIIAPSQDKNVQSVLSEGCWTPVETFGASPSDWAVGLVKEMDSQFWVFRGNYRIGQIKWALLGEHNQQNALAAIAAVHHAGVSPQFAVDALSTFEGVKRRLELKGVVRNIHVYDDFAHHPTAIVATLTALRNRVGNQRIFAIIEFGSNTMRQGHHQETLSESLQAADQVVLLSPQHATWEVETLLTQFKQPVMIWKTVDEIVNYLSEQCVQGDHILCMSNMQFGDIHQKILTQLAKANGVSHA